MKKKKKKTKTVESNSNLEKREGRVGGEVHNEISSPTESMSSIPLVDCVITKPSLDYETIQHMARGGDLFDVLL